MDRIITRQFHIASLVGHIRHSQEVAVTCTREQIKFESYFPTSTNNTSQPNTLKENSHLHSETAVESSECSEYVFTSVAGSQSESMMPLIFGLKELRVCRQNFDFTEIASLQ